MALNDLFDFDTTTFTNNSDVAGSDVAENCAPSGINNAIRALAGIVKRAAGSKGSDIASATTTNIAAAATHLYAVVTGTTTITSFGSVAAGTLRFIEFAGALTLTHNATSLKLPGSANITTAAGDVAVMISLGSGNWKCLAYSKASGAPIAATQAIAVAVTPDTGAVVAATGVKTFRMPYAFTLSAVRGSLATAQTSGSLLTVDINESGSTILSTKLTIDNTEKTSTSAATAAVISDTALADDAEITIDVDQIGDGTAKGLTVYLIGQRA